MANTMARLGSITAPLVKMAGEVFPVLPFIIYGAAPVVSGLVATFLPETRDTALPETVEEVEGRWDWRDGRTKGQRGQRGRDGQTGGHGEGWWGRRVGGTWGWRGGGVWGWVGLDRRMEKKVSMAMDG